MNYQNKSIVLMNIYFIFAVKYNDWNTNIYLNR